MSDKRVFSGVQPTGNIHLGNYLGALKQFVALQDENDCIYCIVDMHSITVPQDPEELKKSIVFVQSEVSGHAELSWILTCNSYTGELSRMTQFKSKSRGQESAPTGLFTYPILMAADILLYDTDIVPVGNDQKQHIELCRDIALRVNHKYGEDTFVVPEGQYMKEGARIMALDDPTNKMSKSAENEMSRISLLDDEKKIKKAIMRATTDSDMTIRFDPENKPGISNLLTIYGALTGTPVAELETKFDGAGYGDLKKSLVTVVTESLAPIQDRFNQIRYSDELLDILRDGSKRAGEIAEPVLERVKDRFGLGI